MKRCFKLSEVGRLRHAVHFALAASVAGSGLLASAAFAQEAQPPAVPPTEGATELDVIEVTGSRLGRADIEGALPLAVINREEIERSGFTSVGELLRNTTFNTLGAFRAQSGSSAQALVAVDLRGLGSERTLVLIDGRRAPKAPFAPSAQDLNSVPIAMVERIEILKDGASAIYGSDAIAGVINIITRKDYSGAALTYQKQGTDRIGGDSQGGQFVSGVSGAQGNLVFGASFFSRDIIFARDSLHNTPGQSFFSNNYFLKGFDDNGADNLPNTNDPGEDDGIDDNTNNYYYGAIPGGCPNADPAFYLLGPNAVGIDNCAYDFNLVAADEAATGNQSVFVKANYKISDSWQLNTSGSVARATSFGRYAPSLNDNPIIIPANSVNNPFFNDGNATNDQDIYLYHRFAALGPRDNDTDANVYDLSGIFSGKIGNVNVDTGIRHNEYQYYELGRNYVVLPVAEQYIIDGTYDIFNPTVNNSASVLNGMKATITRSSIWRTLEYFGEANMPLFEMAGGTSKGAVGIEYRSEQYYDQYDSLQEAGQIGGSAGNSAGTNRKIKSAYFEMFMPVIDQLEVSLSGRFEDYNDVGNNFAPKLSGRYQPADNMTLRASIGQGFRAPTLDIISALPAFSAEAINNDQATCLAAAPTNTYANGTCRNAAGRVTAQQVNTTIISNPNLVAEESDQFSFGFAMDVTPDIDFSVDYYSVKLTDTIEFLSPSDLVDLVNRGIALPAGFSITRNPAQGDRIIGVVAGFANQGETETSGLDLAANFRTSLGEWGRVESSLLATYILSYDVNITGVNLDVVGDPAVPQYRVTLANTWQWGGTTFALNANHIADQAESVSAAGQEGHIPSYTTWDVQAGYDLPWLGGNTNLAAGAINVFGKEPSDKSAFDGRDYNFFLYDQYGVQPYVKFTQKF